MFNDFDINSDDESIPLPAKKKKEEYVEKKCEIIHSSLDYHTIKVPPMVEYKSIDSYCEKKGEKSWIDSDTPISSLRSISSSVMLKSPKPPQPNTPIPSRECQPFCFFSVEELSLVKSLNNWTNHKVCAVGNVVYARNTNECYLNSVGENGNWKILLDILNLEANPAPLKLWQVYGILTIHKEKPKITVNFVRKLRTADLPLFVESYKLMQQYVPKSINVLKSAEKAEQN